MSDPSLASGHLLDAIDRAPAARIALEASGRSVRYGELREIAGRYATGLAALGIKRGARVAVYTDMRIETLLALVGNAIAGITSVPLNPAIGSSEHAHILATARPALRIGAVAREAEIADVEMPFSTIENVLSQRGAAGGSVTRRALSGSDPALILFTSGTTGPPKAAVLTADNCATNLDALSTAWACDGDDVLVHALPVFHVHGLVLGLYGSLRRGGTMRWLERFDGHGIVSQFERGATMMFGVPTMYHRLAETLIARRDAHRVLSSARLFVSGSAPLAVRDHERFERATGHRIVERYGMTETLINAAVRADGDRRAGYVGPALSGVELRRIDEGGGGVDARDDQTVGEILVRGPNVFAGYLGAQNEPVPATDREGWFCTGDLATMAPDGYVKIVGRRSTDLIKTGGFKVGAGEVEASLLDHPAVREAAVVGCTDDDLGERIVAFVVLSPSQPPPRREALIEHVASRLAKHKRPREVHFVAELPRNAMGKVLKRALQNDASKRRGET